VAINSTSSYEQIIAEYKDSEDYEADNSAAKAYRFARAIRYLLVELPNRAAKGSNEINFSKGELKNELDRAVAFARVTDTRSTARRSVVRAAFRQIRNYG